MFCATPGTRDENRDLPFKTNLRAPDDRKGASSGDSSSTHQQNSQSSKKDVPATSTTKEANPEVTSPLKRSNTNKRKGGLQQQVYRKVEMPILMSFEHVSATSEMVAVNAEDSGKGDGEDDGGDKHLTKKKKETPINSENSAAAASQPCSSQ